RPRSLWACGLRMVIGRHHVHTRQSPWPASSTFAVACDPVVKGAEEDQESLLELDPSMRTDVARREIDGEVIVWSPSSPAPLLLDPVAKTLLDVIDGEAPVRLIATEVHEEIGVPLDLAQQQLTRVVQLFSRA